MNKVYILFICFIISISAIQCSSNESNNAMDSIGSVQNEITNFEEQFSIEAYDKEAKEIIDSGKQRLQESVPNSISRQIEIIKKTLTDIKVQPILSLTYTETNLNIKQVQDKSLDYLLIEEIKTNQIYFEIVNELALLNDRYYNYFQEIDKTVEFIDYYKVSPFILGEDVLSKIDELIKDEDIRNKKENINMGVGIGVALITIIPGTATALKIMEQIKVGAIAAKNATLIAKNGKKLSKLTSKLLNKSTGKVFAKAVYNSEKRIKLAKKINRVRNVGYAGEVAYNLAPVIGGASIGFTISHFKSSENKIEGRIGDFSDGVITQPIANLRKILKENKKLLR